MLKALRDNKLYANQIKCQFAQEKLEYLGHLIFGGGVETDPDKVRAG